MRRRSSDALASPARGTPEPRADLGRKKALPSKRHLATRAADSSSQLSHYFRKRRFAMHRRLVALLIASTLSLGAFVTASTASAAESVQLHRAFLGTQSRYGCTQYSAAFDILTTPFGHEKSVYVHLKESDGAWVDLPASF